MKKFYFSIGVFSLLWMGEIYAYKVDVKEKWPSPTPWIKDRLTDFLDCMPKRGRIVEVGVQKGEFASHILDKTNPKQLFLVDCWEHQESGIYNDPDANISNKMHKKLYRKTKKRFAWDSRVVIIKLYSEEAAKKFEDESLDMVYINANHSYEAVKKDLSIW